MPSAGAVVAYNRKGGYCNLCAFYTTRCVSRCIGRQCCGSRCAELLSRCGGGIHWRGELAHAAGVGCTICNCRAFGTAGAVSRGRYVGATEGTGSLCCRNTAYSLCRGTFRAERTGHDCGSVQRTTAVGN